MFDRTDDHGDGKVFSAEDYFQFDGTVRIAGPASRFHKRYCEAESALRAIRPFGVFDAQPAQNVERIVTRIDDPDFGPGCNKVFPITAIEDRSANERHIAILAARPYAKLLFGRKYLDRLVDRLVRGADHERTNIRSDDGAETIPSIGRKRIVFCSYFLPELGLFGGIVNMHTGRQTRCGFQLTASTISWADPAALVRTAVALEPDLAQALNVKV